MACVCVWEGVWGGMGRSLGGGGGERKSGIVGEMSKYANKQG